MSHGSTDSGDDGEAVGVLRRSTGVIPGVTAPMDIAEGRNHEATIFAGRVRAVGKDWFVLSLPSPADWLPSELTEAERKVAALVLEGLSNRAIAQERNTSVRTVANQIASVFRKLKVAGRTELADVVVGRKR